MSIADIMAVLYFDEMKLDPTDPHWAKRDRFVLSKGHACPILSAALARRGYFPLDELKGLRSLDSFLQGHPDMKKIPGVDTVSGSLGNGVAIGLGMALGCRMQGIDSRVYVIVGDIVSAAKAAVELKRNSKRNSNYTKHPKIGRKICTKSAVDDTSQSAL